MDLIPVIQNMTNHQSRFTHAMERLANATADKFSEEGTKKIGNIIKEVVSNAATTNGEEPADELTDFAKDVLSLTGDQPLTLINILFQKHKVRAKPTPKFIAAARKGNLTYDNGIPDGLSLTQLPQSYQGTDIEAIDLARLLNMEENGTITEVDTLTINKSILPISRTLHYLFDKVTAWKVFCNAYFGEQSYVAMEAESWRLWVEENFNALQEIKASRDKDLAVKIEIAISDSFNRIFRTAMLGVPTESMFESELRNGILNNTTYLHIPHTVKEQLDKSNKRKNDNQQQGGGKRSRNNNNNRVTHDNHPREIQLTQDQYRSKAIPYIQQNKDKMPKFDSNTDECMKFALLGICNLDCQRKKAHVKVSKGTTRFDTLAKIKNEILKFTPRASRPDFQQGE